MNVVADTCGRRDVTSLLVLYLFFLRAAADCPKPQGGENIVLATEALLMNSFSENSEVSLVCVKGYVRESGSGSIICTGGHWSEPDLVCTKKDCGAPKPQPHMTFNISTGTLFGSIIGVVCDTGYMIIGTSYMQCYDSGWSGRSRCEIATCEKPGEVTNGKTSWDSQDDPKYGEIIQYSCDDGYTLSGKGDIMCSETGEYDSPIPECRGGDVSAAEGQSAPTSTTSTTPASLREHEKPGGAVEVNESTGYTPVIISVTVVLVVVCILVFLLHKYLLRRHGSYDTREDQKPELLHFQNL